MLMALFWTLAVIIALFVLFYKFVFLRDPARQIPAGKTIACPADGDVAAILDITGKDSVVIPKGRIGRIKTMCKDVKDAKHVILIVMNLWHVHVNRAPIQGRIMKVDHKQGKFVNAVAGAETFPTIENERVEILYKSPSIMAKTIQLAGVLARRIQPFVKKGELVMKGQRIGRIIMGSQVALILPKKVKLDVKVGDAVKAGETVIGRW